MVKYNYFETLKQLSALASDAISHACGTVAPKGGPAQGSIRKSSDRLVCELEDALFSDFLPPLERENLAACAHSLSRLTDRALELATHTALLPSMHRGHEEGKICIRLASELGRAIEMLPHIRKPSEMPDIQGFRRLLNEGRAAHAAMLDQLHTGILPRSMAQTIIMTGRLRAELSHSFDELVEIMLNNI